MKQFDTFIQEQKELLNEKKGSGATKSDPRTGSANKSTMASMHGDSVVVAVGTTPSFVNHISDKAVHDFGKMLSNFSPLSKAAFPSSLVNNLKSIIDNMETSHKKTQMIQQMRDIVTLPASADRTLKVQNFSKEMKGIALELQKGSTKYMDYTDSSNTFIPYKWTQ